jgi:dipeptidyl aminopeptidase/acylaminoacyl peptidase
MNTPLIARKALFGNPDKSSAGISPDGRHLAWLAAVDGVMNVWVAPRDNTAAANPVTRDTLRGIRFYWWSYTGAHILFGQDKNGDENWRIYAVDLESMTTRDLTPFEGVNAQPIAMSHSRPDEMLIGLNHRAPEWHDVYHLTISTGALNLVCQHDRFAGFVADNDLKLRIAQHNTDEGGAEYLQAVDGDWVHWASVPPEDMLTTSPIGFDEANATLYMRDSRGRDTAALVSVDLGGGVKSVLADSALADLHDVVAHPRSKRPQAASFIYERKQWQCLDEAFQRDLDALHNAGAGEVEITSRTLDDRYWTVCYTVDTGTMRHCLYDRSVGTVATLFAERAELDGMALVPMRSVVVKSRDGMNLVSYYSLPNGSDSNGDGLPDHPLPMVLMPHGGPWGRDFWGFSEAHQWLANRGYVTMCVNFRASAGFGKAFLNAGNHEWGGAIMADQIDVVRWAIESGIADPGKVAVMGGSFGGYSTLAGLAFTPDVFACGIDIVGPANLVTLLESIPPYWKPTYNMFTSRIGDPATEEGRALLTRHSPLTAADAICRPLLIAHGANDPRVKRAESDQIVAALQGKAVPVTYVMYPDEGHGFARPENNVSFLAVAEAFLARQLGGRSEPIGDDFRNSSIEVLQGVEHVDGLQEALKA